MLAISTHVKRHISAGNLRSGAHRTVGTPALRCSFSDQTAPFHVSPDDILEKLSKERI